MENAIYVVLMLTSVVSLTFIIERALALRLARVIPPVLEEAVENCQAASDLPMLRRLCDQHPSPLGRLLLVASNHLDCPKGENIDALQTKARHEMAQLERGLVVLEIITGIAPLLGLVGTVYGLIMLFTGLGQQSLAGDNTLFAAGIALALRATLMGLIVAIPSLIAWSYFSKKVESLAVELETLCDEFLQRRDAVHHPQAPLSARRHHRLVDRRADGRAHLPDGHDDLPTATSGETHAPRVQAG